MSRPRFGPLGALAHRLASGRDGRLLDERPVPPDLAVAAELDPPAERVDHAAFVAKALADELQAAARPLAAWPAPASRSRPRPSTASTSCGCGVTREGSLLRRSPSGRAGSSTGGSTSTQRPTSGITLLRLVPDEVGAARGRQLGFWGGRTLADERAARAFARVQGLLGVDAVSLPEVRGRALTGRARRARPGRLAEPGRMMAPAPDAPWPGRVPPPLPAAVHAQLIAQVDVRDRHGEPVVVSGRGLLSSRRRRSRAAGEPKT